MQNEYFAFVGAAYALSVLALAALGLWIFLDARVQRRALKALEERGVTRRSQRARPAEAQADGQAAR